MHLLLQFHRENKIYDFISFTKTRSSAPQFKFFELLKNILNIIFLQILRFYARFVLFCFYWKQMETEALKLWLSR